MTSPATRDLFVLVADSQLQRTIATLLEHRLLALEIGDISFEVQRHPGRDPGCRIDADSFLRHIQDNYRKVMVVFDFEGCGASNTTAGELEGQLEQQIENAGWELDRVAVIVIEPELEAWLFGGTFSHLEQAIGWSHPQPIQHWLVSGDHLSSGLVKPADPKAAMEALLLQAGRPRSSKLYADMAEKMSLVRCRDRAFQKFRATLQHWFPVS